MFYSDISDGKDSLADTGFPSSLYTNTLAVIETGPEGGPNGYIYTPTAGQPGFVAGASGPVTYVIQSDSLQRFRSPVRWCSEPSRRLPPWARPGPSRAENGLNGTFAPGTDRLPAAPPDMTQSKRRAHAGRG